MLIRLGIEHGIPLTAGFVGKFLLFNGALLVQTEVVRVPDSDPVCSGKVSRAAVIYYKSVVGYRGPDSFSYEEVPDSGQVFEIDITIK